MTQPDFNTDCIDTVFDILDRAQDMCYDPALRDPLSFTMDITAANGLNGNAPLDLEKLLAFKDLDFLHDISGIVAHMNRNTGKLMNEFRPRCAK